MGAPKIDKLATVLCLLLLLLFLLSPNQVTLFELLHVVGLALLTFTVLPQLDVTRGAMLGCCVCFVPSLLSEYNTHICSCLHTHLHTHSLPPLVA